MKNEQFDALRAQAIELHKSQKGEKVSLDAIFGACALLSRGPRVSRPSDEDPPGWFHDTLKSLRGTGEKFTVSRFLILAGQYPATRTVVLQVGRWLREEGITPSKVGGQTLFEAPKGRGKK